MSVGISNNYTNIQRNERKISFEGIRAEKYIDKCVVPDSFKKEMIKGIESIDKRVFKQIVRVQNLRYKLGLKATHVFPELRFTKCPMGLTPDEMAGVCKDGGKIIGLFMNPDRIRGAKKIKTSANIVRHETGHSLHLLFKKIIGSDFAETKGYTEAYLKDITNLSENLKKYEKKVKNAHNYIDYLTQGSTPQQANGIGKKETFAEIFAILNGGSATESYLKGMDKMYKKIFPNTVAYVEKLLWLMGKR